MLTRQQKKLMVFIQAYSDSNDGIAPTIREMMVGIGSRSTQAVHGFAKRLEERGYIKRLPNRARALEILKRVKA